MTADPATTDPALVDRNWVGYHPRAMAPAIAVALAMSVVVWTGHWFLDDISVLAERVGASVVFVVAWGVWPALAAVFLYRTVTYTYRLTDRALLVDFGMFSAPVVPVTLADVTAVVVGGDWLGRALGVGWVEVRTADRAVRMNGVRHAGSFAIKIRHAVTACRRE